jgi:primosomal protein N'
VRAGASLPGEVIVQTDFPTHPLARALASHDYDRFAEVLLAERRAAMLPPFAHLALLVAEAPRRDAVDAFLAAASDAGRAAAREQAIDVEVFAPVPAALARRAGLERGQVLAQAVEGAQCNASFRTGGARSIRFRAAVCASRSTWIRSGSHELGGRALASEGPRTSCERA